MASEKARKAAARKRATFKAQERTRRSLMTPGKVVEQGVGWGNIARGVARIVGSTAKASGKAGRPAANPSSRAAKQAAKKTSSAKKTPAKKRNPYRDTQLLTKSERQQKVAMKNLRNTGASARKAKAKAKKISQQGYIAGGVAGGVGAAGIAGGAAMQYKNRRPKGRMPIRPKKK